MLKIYADNCKAQNKNKILMAFFYWIVHVKGWIDYVEINFLIVGHTKFSVDRHFGLFKSLVYTMEKVENLKQVANIINESSLNEC